jgi:hypothetical protein
MDVQEMIDSWQAERREIISSLPPAALKRYEELGIAIRYAKAVLAVAPKVEQSESDSARVPFGTRKEQLLAFLRERGGATRGEILSTLDIPVGTLSVLLNSGRKAGWLLRNDEGKWQEVEQ